MGNKIQKIYVGTNLVRPVYRYSYDFGGKTWSEVQDDGWFLIGGQTPSFNSDGMYYNSWVSTVGIDGIFDLTDAKKLTLSVRFKCPSNFDGLGFRICNYNGGTRTYENGTWIGYNNVEALVNGTVVKSQSKSYSQGWNTLVITYDLENKTYAFSNYVTISGTLNDTQIASIRSDDCIYFMMSRVTVGTVTFTVE